MDPSVNFNKLLNLSATDKLHHALLLTGQDIDELNEQALVLAKSILCLSNNKNNLACDVCQSCKLFAAKSHLDYLDNLENISQKTKKSKGVDSEVTPKVSKLAVAKKNLAETIKIDTVRKINNFIANKPQLSTNKVIVIFAAHNLNIQASNAFLKTLEEPAGDTIIILTTNNFGSLLDTIVSRCFTVNLNSVVNDNSAVSKTTLEQAEELLALIQGFGTISSNLQVPDKRLSDDYNSSNLNTKLKPQYQSQYKSNNSSLNNLNQKQSKLDPTVNNTVTNNSVTNNTATNLDTVTIEPLILYFMQDLQHILADKNANIVEIAEKWDNLTKSKDCLTSIYKAIAMVIVIKFSNAVSPFNATKAKLFSALNNLTEFSKIAKSGQNPNFQLFLIDLLTKLR